MNLIDVAKRARVSTATVSRVLNGGSGVRPATRERVERAVAALGYTPNLIARSLAGGRSRSIGMIVSNLENPFFLDIFRSVERHARQRGYEILVANTDYSSDRLAASIAMMHGRRVAGLALVVSESVPSNAAVLAGRDIPIVLYDGSGDRFKQAMNIRANYRAGMRQIVEYLYALGHRRMAFVGHHTSLGPLDARRRAFLAVTRDLAPRIKVTTVADDDGLAGGQRAMQQILATDFRPTAIACVNDIMAIGVLRELRANGFSVPGDVSVTGFDNITLAEYTSPALTTADIPRAEIGRLIVESLLRRVTGPGRGGRGGEIVLQPELIVRSSTSGPPRAGRKKRR
jgi:DNA-binding LacI/PurR family transcriptional regulator